DKKPGNVHHQFQKLLTELNKPTDAYELKIANRLYGEKTYEFLQEYLDNVKEFYLAGVESVDFKNAAEESEKKINSWVETQTNGKKTAHYRNTVEYPLEDKLTAEKLIEWTSSQNMSKRDVDLYLPRFKVEERYDLRAMLMAIGMVDVFSPQDADLTGMTGSRGLAVTKVLHKSFVEVTEEGAEAAAATGITVKITSARYPVHEEFHCNHPFLFFIKQNKTNSILFFGRVSSP
ncbi:PREDICTED: serpin B3-like, partial [Propithecus coquereli]|uniref:serpin B3-like n=1 Tax=Propithecus coquereli TaxID=379532 RepID=UPI00063F4BFF